MTDTTEENRLVTIEELAAAIGVCRRTVEAHVRNGRIPTPIRFGRKIRWPYSELERMVAEGVGVQL